MHRAALAFGIAALAAGQFGHHTFGVHATGQHMAVITVGCQAVVALFGGGLKPDNDGLLANVKMAEPADQTHAI